jgi:hypothetical protein
MDDELLRWLYHRLLHDPILSRTRDCTYSDGLIALIDLFMALHNCSAPWACDRRNWPLWCRRLKLPSTSQFNKRRKSTSVRGVICLLNDELRQRLPHSIDKVADGKAMIVSGFSHDPDATRGHVPGGFARGYKLHVIVDACGAIDAFELTPLHAGEATVLRELIARADVRGVTLRADANYDSNLTYHAAADAGARLLAPRRKPHRRLGHHRQHPDRLLAITQLEQTPGGLSRHKRHRNRVEQTLARLSSLPFGLWALPNFVRRLSRVRCWVTAKITLYHLRQTQIHHSAAAA